MPFVPVPKDLTKVKTKIALNLTKRQLICFSIAAITGIPIYLLTRNTIGNDIAAVLMVTIMLPFFFLAIYEKDGQSCEKILRNIIMTKFLYPRTRPFKTENIYGSIEKQNKLNTLATKETDLRNSNIKPTEVKSIENKSSKTTKTKISRTKIGTRKKVGKRK